MPPGEQFRRYYPGLIPIEALLWRGWLREHETDFQAFEYNVHVGEGISHPMNRDLGLSPEIAESNARMFRMATQKKIDVVGFQGETTWIFEVEERPGTRALGQILTYRTLLAKQRPGLGLVALALVCRRLGLDMLETFEEAGIIVWQEEAPGAFVRGQPS